MVYRLLFSSSFAVSITSRSVEGNPCASESYNFELFCLFFLREENDSSSSNSTVAISVLCLQPIVQMMTIVLYRICLLFAQSFLFLTISSSIVFVHKKQKKGIRHK